jgi:hypothetical protein
VLLLRFVAGEPEAFVAFYRLNLAAVVAFFLRRTGDREVTADLAAEVFAAALIAAPRCVASALSGTDRVDDPEHGRRGPRDDLVAREIDRLREPAVDDRSARTDEHHAVIRASCGSIGGAPRRCAEITDRAIAARSSSA